MARPKLSTIASGVFVAFLCGLAPAAPPDAPADRYKAALLEARFALKKGQWKKARRACQAAGRLADEPAHGGVKKAKAAALCGDIELKSKRYKRAAFHYSRASRWALQENSQRTSLLKKRIRAAAKAKAKKAAEVARSLQLSDQTLAFSRKKSRPDRIMALQEATLAYRQDKDMLRAARATILRARLMAKEGSLDGARKALGPMARYKKKPAHIRILALEALAQMHLLENKLRPAVEVSIRASGIEARGLEGDALRYARTAQLDRVCERYDEESGDGACARLQRRITGRFTLTDFSRRKRTARRSARDLKKVHRQFVPVLEECVLSAVKRDRDRYRDVDLQIGWAVNRDGRARQPLITPPRYEADILPCVSDRVAWLRYTPVRRHERQNISIPFHLD